MEALSTKCSATRKEACSQLFFQQLLVHIKLVHTRKDAGKKPLESDKIRIKPKDKSMVVLNAASFSQKVCTVKFLLWSVTKISLLRCVV